MCIESVAIIFIFINPMVLSDRLLYTVSLICTAEDFISKYMEGVF
jgi:hypothetical protein